MRRKLLAGNWKMNGHRAEATALARDLAARLASGEGGCEWAICPPFPLIGTVAGAIQGSYIAVGAQDCHSAPSGPHTGDVAAPMLADMGCAYAIVGHSERRRDHGETDEVVRAKAEAAQASGIAPIVCVGETQSQREAGETEAVLARQVETSVPEQPVAGLAVAYEPVWAIGTGLTPTSDEIAAALASIREVLARRFDSATAERIRLLYGGSVKPANAAELWRIDGVDGLLVGAASLSVERFWSIGRSCPDS
ncbi:triosephosphate isomerase [Limimonas halophila]|uniref:Triosephosphate isomerase n=1 Tax=Limimonas halophila TaxID=1082479 RepID=A0A1G7NCY0_9PROT|nr:triose-phosphate isomerase [Limimonas halophila]SDF71189.1 triosephosphate isomerase [Limimonas halophila]